jgi:hypothetical protein
MESLLAGSISFTNHGRRETNDKIQIGLGHTFPTSTWTYSPIASVLSFGTCRASSICNKRRVGKSQWKRESLVVVWSLCVSCRLSRRYIKTGAKNKIKKGPARNQKKIVREKLETRSLVVIRFLFFGVNRRSSAESWWMTMTVCIFRVEAMTDSFSDLSSTLRFNW